MLPHIIPTSVAFWSLTSGFLLLTSSSHAAIPQFINFQGRLTDTNNNPVTGSYNMTFKIFDALTSGTQLWTETQNITVIKGVYSVRLGGATPIPVSVFSGDTTYLEFQLEGEPQAFTPRQRFLSSGYAFNSATLMGYTTAYFVSTGTVQTIDGVKTFTSFPVKSGDLNPSANGEFATKQYVDVYGGPALLASTNTWTARQTFTRELTVSNTNFYVTGGNVLLTGGQVGIGTMAPSEKLEVKAGNIKALDGGVIASSITLSGLSADPSTATDGSLSYLSSGKLRLRTGGAWVDITTGTISGAVVDLNSTQTLGGVKTFTSFPKKSGSGSDLVPSADGEFATKSYVDLYSGPVLLASTNTWTAQQTFTRELTVSNTNFYVTGGNVGIGTTSPTAGKLSIYQAADPGTTPAALDIVTPGVSGGTATNQYGIRFIGNSYNNASVMYGIYSYAFQNTGGVSYGIYAETGGSATSNTYGVYGKGRQIETNGGGISYGVYGTVVSAGLNGTGKTYAGYFDNQSATGNTAVGLYVNSVAGATNNYSAIFMGGNVGIGTTAPVYDLDMAGTGVNAKLGGNPGVTSVSTIGTGASNAFVGGYAANTAYLGQNVYYDGSWVSPDTTANKTSMLILQNGEYYFYTGTSASWSERLYISNAGGVAIGGYADSRTDPGVNNLIVSGNVGIGTTAPGYNLTVNGTAWVTSGAWTGSDRRWKKDITPLKDSLSTIMKLRGVNYNWKTEEFPELKFSTAPQIGLIAQDTEKILPEVVTTDNNGYKGISYEKLVPVLIEAIKEQERKIAALEAKLNAGQ